MKDNKLEEFDKKFGKLGDESINEHFNLRPILYRVKQFINDNYTPNSQAISKKEVKQIIKELEYDEADLISKRFILTILNKLT